MTLYYNGAKLCHSYVGDSLFRAKRLNEMIMMVNRMKKFTVGELAHELVVSKRTIFN
jgi:hypothetical protein